MRHQVYDDIAHDKRDYKMTSPSDFGLATVQIVDPLKKNDTECVKQIILHILCWMLWTNSKDVLIQKLHIIMCKTAEFFQHILI